MNCSPAKLLPARALFSAFCSVCVSILLLASFPAAAQFNESQVARSIVSVNVYRGKDVQRRVTGFVVQSDRFDGYVVTNMSLLGAGDTFTVACRSPVLK